MKNKVLKLCKRLNRVTISDIAPILCLSSVEVATILEELVSEELLEKRIDETYFYIEKDCNKPLPLFFECRTPVELELIKRCFSADLTCIQTEMILDLKNDIIAKFNKYFRKYIYDKQYEKLIAAYNKKPQIPRMRCFFDIPVYFYYYDGITYVSEKMLNSPKTEIALNKKEVAEFKKSYCKIRRRIYHYGMKSYLTHHIAEAILRMYLSFEEIVEFIN